MEDVIRISQLDEGEVPYEWTETDLYETAKNVFGILSEAAKKQDVHLYIEGDRIKLHTVPNILEEVLFNICDNAIKYNKQGGSVCIRLTENETMSVFLYRITALESQKKTRAVCSSGSTG